MSIHKADDFIKKVVIDKEIRKKCYFFKTKEALAENFGFTLPEFDDALNALLFKCKTYDQAEVLRQIQMWFAMFHYREEMEAKEK